MIPEVEVRVLGRNDAAAYQSLRLLGLRESPETFGSTFDEDAALPIETVADRLAETSAPRARCVVGAFEGGELVGVVACVQEPKVKARHKAAVLGMYVRPDARGRGIGRELLTRLIAQARTWAGVERLTLTVVERATSARHLYLTAGFRIFGREPDGLRQDGERDTVEYLTLDLSQSP